MIAKPSSSHPLVRGLATLASWFDARAAQRRNEGADQDAIDWLRLVPFLALHVGCAFVFVVGVSTTALVACALAYAVRMFAITAFYHRYFGHRAFRTSRFVQFLFAALGNAAGQRGPLWWAAHHRRHHKHADTGRDAHSPHDRGVLWSHVLWFTTRRNFATDLQQIPDFARFPELRFLDRFDVIAPLALAGGTYALGELLAAVAPSLATSGPQLLVWGFFVSTTLLFHGTSSINSLGHLFGSRRYPTPDTSRNSFLLALLTFGEGWHNNHHFYPVAARQGFRWWELDLTWYGLLVLAKLGIVHDLAPVPGHVLEGRRTPRRGRS
ncbi:MAG: acyl-CoA desaturase [Planctomycetes bacterium]|nr:acyl-CoA desaturase [Planctomycetota bacterium]